MYIQGTSFPHSLPTNSKFPSGFGLPRLGGFVLQRHELGLELLDPGALGQNFLGFRAHAKDFWGATKQLLQVILISNSSSQHPKP